MRTGHVGPLLVIAASLVGLPVGVVDAQTTSPIDQVEVNPTGFVASVYDPGAQGFGNGSGGPIDCRWRVVDVIGDAGRLDNVLTGLEQLDGVTVEGTRAYRDIGGERHLLYSKAGSDCVYGLVWVSTALDPTDALPALRDSIERVLPLPSPNMSPAPDVGSYVNLGLWVAVEDPGVTTDRATLGPVWAEGSGTLVSIEVDPGDGSEPFVCDGVGVPIVDVNIKEEGPCGHTYLQSSPNDDPYRLSITSVYEVTYRLSNGVTGSLGEVRRSESWDYDVDELQTLGTG